MGKIGSLMGRGSQTDIPVDQSHAIPQGYQNCLCGALPLPKTKPASPLVSADFLPLSLIWVHPPGLPPVSPILLTQNCKCLVVTMTYCLGQCSFPMHIEGGCKNCEFLGLQPGQGQPIHHQTLVTPPSFLHHPLSRNSHRTPDSDKMEVGF